MLVQLVLHVGVLGAPLVGGSLQLVLQIGSLILVLRLKLRSHVLVLAIKARFHVDMIG